MRGLLWEAYRSATHCTSMLGSLIEDVDGDGIVIEVGLGVAIEALRAIAHASSTDTRSRGVAQKALRKLRVE